MQKHGTTRFNKSRLAYIAATIDIEQAAGIPWIIGKRLAVS